MSRSSPSSFLHTDTFPGSHTNRFPLAGGIRLVLPFVLVALGATAKACEPAKPSEASGNQPLAVTDKGEALIKTLSTTNRPPRLFKGAELVFPIFPEEFDWKEYARVRAAITDLDTNSENVWPSVVEHMTDTDYCFTAAVDDSAVNYTRGDVCVRIAQNWINGGYLGHMPTGQQLRLPVKGSMALQEWCRARRDKTFVEMEIEAAEWAISTLQAERRVPQELLDAHVGGISKEINGLRETNKPRHYKFFITDAVRSYDEKTAARFRGLYGSK